MSNRICLACGKWFPADEIIGGRCDQCAAEGRPVNEKLRNNRLMAQETTIEHRVVKPCQSAREILESVIEKRHTSRQVTEGRRAEAEKSKRRAESARNRMIAKLNAVGDSALVSIHELLASLQDDEIVSDSGTICLRERGDIEWSQWQDEQGNMSQLCVQMGNVECIERWVDLDVDHDVGLSFDVMVEELEWSAPAIEILVSYEIGEGSKLDLVVTTTTRDALLEMECPRIVVWRLNPQRPDPITDDDIIEPVRFAFPKSRAPRRIAANWDFGAAHQAEIDDLDALDRMTDEECEHELEEDEDFKDNWELYETSLNQARAYDLERDVYENLSSDFDFSELPRVKTLARTSTRRMRKPETVFRTICTRLVSYLESNLAKNYSRANLAERRKEAELIKALGTSERKVNRLLEQWKKIPTVGKAKLTKPRML